VRKEEAFSDSFYPDDLNHNDEYENIYMDIRRGHQKKSGKKIKCIRGHSVLVIKRGKSGGQKWGNPSQMKGGA